MREYYDPFFDYDHDPFDDYGDWEDLGPVGPYLEPDEEGRLNYEAEQYVPPEDWSPEELVQDAIRPATGTVTAQRVG